MDLEASKSAYINQWMHCQDKQLIAADSHITCGCGKSWSWADTLGATMEMLEWSEEVRLRNAPSVNGAEQPGLF
jgi:hypothetical protein